MSKLKWYMIYHMVVNFNLMIHVSLHFNKMLSTNGTVMAICTEQGENCGESDFYKVLVTSDLLLPVIRRTRHMI